jgi:hypothetical protein
MLSERYADQLENILVDPSEWKPYPTLQDRDAWASLPDAVKNAHLKAGEEALGYAWPGLPLYFFNSREMATAAIIKMCARRAATL